MSYRSVIMLTRPWTSAFVLLATATLAGCAGGEIDPSDGDPGLGNFVRDAPVRGNLYIEVTDPRGTPIQPELVILTADGGEPLEAQCWDPQQGGCTVWLGDFEAMEWVTAWATTPCGHRFGTTVPLGPEVDEAEPFEAAVTVVSVSGLCDGRDPSP